MNCKFFLVDATFTSDNSSYFRKNLLEKLFKIIIAVDDRIRDGKFQEAARISALLSVKIDKYEYLSGEDILPSGERRMIKQTKFTCFPLEKALK